MYFVPDGTRFAIGTATGAPVTVTGISNANPAIVSAAAHGLAAKAPFIAYFSDRGRLFQADRGRRIGVAVAALGKRAGTGVNVS